MHGMVKFGCARLVVKSCVGVLTLEAQTPGQRLEEDGKTASDKEQHSWELFSAPTTRTVLCGSRQSALWQNSQQHFAECCTGVQWVMERRRVSSAESSY